MDYTRLSRDNIVSYIADLVDRRGGEVCPGDEVTVAEHMLQAALLAEDEGAGDEMIAAALLHDIGHYAREFPADAMPPETEGRHDIAGARLLSAFFPASVSEPVRRHVAGKRYLCALDQGYFRMLSQASAHSLGFQGGPMSPEEVAAFDQDPWREEAVRLRLWDEAAKVKARPTPPFDHFAPVLERMARSPGN